MLFYLLTRGYSGPEILFNAIEIFIAISLAFGFHEFMHAKVADWLGDKTPAMSGRLTLNPLAHVDMMGMILLLLVGFGWGKPVVVNPSNFKRFKSRKLMSLMVSLAGVTGNFLLAFVSSVAGTLINCLFGDPSKNIVVYVIAGILGWLVNVNLGLMAFNLLPIPPLDGFSIVDAFIPLKTKYNSVNYRKFIAFGPRVLLILIVLGRISRIDILGIIMGLIEFPAQFVITLVDLLIIHLLGGGL